MEFASFEFGQCLLAGLRGGQVFEDFHRLIDAVRESTLHSVYVKTRLDGSMFVRVSW